MDLQDKRVFPLFHKLSIFQKLNPDFLGVSLFAMRAQWGGGIWPSYLSYLKNLVWWGKGTKRNGDGKRSYSIKLTVLDRIMRKLLVAQTWGPSCSVKMGTVVTQLSFPQWMNARVFQWCPDEADSPCVEGKDWWWSGRQTDNSLESEFTVSSLYLLLRLLFPFRFPPEILVCLQSLEIINSPSLDLCCYVVCCLLCADKLNVLIMKSAVMSGHTCNRDRRNVIWN